MCIDMCMDMCTDMCMCVCIDMCMDMCMHMCMDMCIDMCMDMCIDMCMDMCMAMCICMCIDMCTGMCTDMCMDMYMDMYIDMCIDMRVDMDQRPWADAGLGTSFGRTVCAKALSRPLDDDGKTLEKHPAERASPTPSPHPAGLTLQRTRFLTTGAPLNNSVASKGALLTVSMG